jgi:hypothetical protein
MSHILEAVGTKVIVILTDIINSPLPYRIRFLFVPPLASRMTAPSGLGSVRDLKERRGVELQLHIFLTSAICGI